MSSIKPRRSPRVATKAPVEYFNVAEAIEKGIEKFCAKRGFIFTDELRNESLEYMPPNKPIWLHDYHDFINNSLDDRLNLVSKEIKRQKDAIKGNTAIIKYCEKKGITYEPEMVEKYMQWKYDPANRWLTIKSDHPKSCDCRFCCDENIIRLLERTPSECVHKWFSTLTV